MTEPPGGQCQQHGGAGGQDAKEPDPVDGDKVTEASPKVPAFKHPHARHRDTFFPGRDPE